IQGLNVASGDPTFLVLPELIATSVPVTSDIPIYFTAPTPGAANTSGTTNIGPQITEVGHVPNVPIGSEDWRVTARLIPTFNAVPTATLRYRIMFANEVSVPMNDGGTNGDLVAGDGVWSAIIPASASTNGQMIRYYVTALDTLGNFSKWPLFYNATNSEQYLGTIVDPTNVVSKIPIFHVFFPRPQRRTPPAAKRALAVGSSTTASSMIMSASNCAAIHRPRLTKRPTAWNSTAITNCAIPAPEGASPTPPCSASGRIRRISA